MEVKIKFSENHKFKFIFRFKSTPQKFSSKALINRVQVLPRGKGLGGCHQLNYLLHHSGCQHEFDHWGAENWGKEFKHFIENHGYSRNEINDTPKLSITSIEIGDSKLTEAFVEAENEMKMNFNPNIFFKLAQFTTRKGVRHSVYHEYLRKAFNHKNLKILLHAKVEKIIFSGKKATGVKVRTESNETFLIRAKREIIVSAGSFNTPQILKLSGIGNQEEIKGAGIELVHHLPAIGGLNRSSKFNKP